MASKSSAEREGYRVLEDQDLFNGVVARTRQLEAEKSAHLLVLEEEKALGNDDAVAELEKLVATHDKRLAVVYSRRDALASSLRQAAQAKEAEAKAAARAKAATTDES